MPDEVHRLADGVAVMDAIVAQYPGLEDVQRGQEQRMAEKGIETIVVDQGAVGRVVPEHEHARHSQAGQQPQRHDQQPRLGKEEPDDRAQVDRDAARHLEQPTTGRALSTRRRNRADYVSEGDICRQRVGHRRVAYLLVGRQACRGGEKLSTTTVIMRETASESAVSARRGRRPRSDVETEIHDIAVGHQVVLALRPDLAQVTRGRPGSRCRAARPIGWSRRG